MEWLLLLAIGLAIGIFALIGWIVYWLCYGLGRVVGVVAAPVVVAGIAASKGINNVRRVVNALGDAEELAELTVDAEDYVARKKGEAKQYWADFKTARKARKSGTVAPVVEESVAVASEEDFG